MLGAIVGALVAVVALVIVLALRSRPTGAPPAQPPAEPSDLDAGGLDGPSTAGADQAAHPEADATATDGSPPAPEAEPKKDTTPSAVPEEAPAPSHLGAAPSPPAPEHPATARKLHSLPVPDADQQLAELAREVARLKPGYRPDAARPKAPARRPTTHVRRAGRFKPVLGIDFGTSNTCAAWVDEGGETRMVKVEGTDCMLPTVLWFSTSDKFVVGARDKIIDAPTQTVFGFKRFIGRSFRSEFVSRNVARFPYQIVAGTDGQAAVEIFGDTKTLQHLAFYVIQRMVELARAAAGHDFDATILTMPAHFGHPQRKVIRVAAEMAGLEVLAVVNEPTAAAFYYSRQRGTDGTALIYDLGGGTFDATLVSIESDVVKVLATGGDAFLGGADFDERIAQAVAKDFEKQHNVDLTDQKVVMQRLTFASEQAKIELSQNPEAIIRVPFATEKDGEPLDIEYKLNREAMDIITAPLVEKTLGACEELLKVALMEASDVDEVILVGGQTRTLALRRRVFAVFQFDPDKNLNPEMTVCVGAAMLGRAMLDQAPALVDVVGVPIWVTVPGAGMKQVLHAQTAVPCVRRVTVDQRPPGDGPMSFVVFEALQASSVDRAIFGRVVLEPEWLKANPGPIHLEFKMTQSFALQVTVSGSQGARQPVPLLSDRG